MRYAAMKAKDLHAKTITDARESFAPVFAFLTTATDCVGPSLCDGVPSDRLDALMRPRWRGLVGPSTLDACRVLVDELVAAGRPTRLDWGFHFRMQSPDPAAPFVYPPSDGVHPNDDPHMSWLSLTQRTSEPTTIALQLVWPVDEHDPRLAPARDQAFAALGLRPRPRCWSPT